MSVDASVAHRAAAEGSINRPVGARSSRHGPLVLFLAALLAVGSLATPAPASAATIKVAIVVGPAGSLTKTYKSHARSYAALARSYGATVVEVYSPKATWARVKGAVQGANLLIYLGHGNGYPNPYSSTLDPRKVNGLGLNPKLNSGNTKTKYYGEYFVKKAIKLAPNAVVLLNHLCYSAGSSEPGRKNPSLKTAKKRVDNFGAGFLRAGARTVFAETLGNASYVIRSLFTTGDTMTEIFWSSPNRTKTHQVSFSSARTSGMGALMDPRKPGQYYRSVVGKLSMTAATWRP